MKNIIDFSTELRELHVLREQISALTKASVLVSSRIEERCLKLLQDLGMSGLSPAEMELWNKFLDGLKHLEDRQYLVHLLVDHGLSLRSFLKVVVALKNAPFEEILRQATAEEDAAKKPEQNRPAPPVSSSTDNYPQTSPLIRAGIKPALSHVKVISSLIGPKAPCS